MIAKKNLPGGPAMIMLGTLPSLAKTANLDTVSETRN